MLGADAGDLAAGRLVDVLHAVVKLHRLVVHERPQVEVGASANRTGGRPIRAATSPRCNRRSRALSSGCSPPRSQRPPGSQLTGPSTAHWDGGRRTQPARPGSSTANRAPERPPAPDVPRG